jgi:hypothetical protein
LPAFKSYSQKQFFCVESEKITSKPGKILRLKLFMAILSMFITVFIGCSTSTKADSEVVGHDSDAITFGSDGDFTIVADVRVESIHYNLTHLYGTSYSYEDIITEPEFK